MWFKGPNPGLIVDSNTERDGILAGDGLRILRLLVLMNRDDDRHVKKLGRSLNYKPISPDIVHRAYPCHEKYLGNFDQRTRISIKWGIAPNKLRENCFGLCGSGRLPWLVTKSLVGSCRFFGHAYSAESRVLELAL